MKKVVSFLLILVGVALISFGGYKIYANSIDKEENKEENKDDNSEQEGNEGENTDKNNNDKLNDISAYLKEKYNEEFEALEFVKSFCFEEVDNGLAYSETCDDDKIMNSLYKFKDSNGVIFYVKDVRYDDSKITLTSEEDIDTQSVGYYDNYINVIVANKLEGELLASYKAIFIDIIEVEIHDGLGTGELEKNNGYRTLGKSSNLMKDKDITLDEFLATINPSNYSIVVQVKSSSDITKDNFKYIVENFEDSSKFASSNSLININRIIMQFSNDNRYIVYENGGLLTLQRGEDFYDSVNEKVYDKTIKFVEIDLEDSISYEDFKNEDLSLLDF